jgi:hypothetical protein
MKTQIVCLANSYKEGGRCLAGIVTSNGNPIIENNTPKWVRPVCETEHGQVPTSIVKDINLLDIIEIDIIQPTPNNYQTENVLFNENSIQTVDRLPLEQLHRFCNNEQNTLFGNKGKAVCKRDVASLSHSLTLIEIKEFRIYENI